jgi:predicted nuclease of predicted toxin-antitoxin system
MNLSPEWVQEFKRRDVEAVHWSTVGRFDAADKVLMEFARQNQYVIFTHDLDFGTALALTKAEKPSVVQVRTQNVTIPHLTDIVFSTIKTYEIYLKRVR